MIQSKTTTSFNYFITTTTKSLDCSQEPQPVFCFIWEPTTPTSTLSMCHCVNVQCAEFFFVGGGSLHLDTHANTLCLDLGVFVPRLKIMCVCQCMCSFENGMIQKGDFKASLSSAREAKWRHTNRHLHTLFFTLPLFCLASSASYYRRLTKLTHNVKVRVSVRERETKCQTICL